MVKQTAGSSQPQANNGGSQNRVSKALEYTINPGAPVLYLILATLTHGPGLKHVFLTAIAIMTIGFVRWTCKTPVGKKIHDEMENWLLYWFNRITYRRLTPDQLITWLTKHRFDISVGCERNKSRRFRLFGPNGEPCRRELCHFGPFKRGDDIPRFFKKHTPYRARGEKALFIGPARLGGKSYKGQGYLLGWTSTGVAIELPLNVWSRISNPKPMRCVLHIRLRPLLGWFVDYCIRVYPLDVTEPKGSRHSSGPRDGVRVFGEFEVPHKPPKNLPKLCVCPAWEMQGRRPPGCTYASFAPPYLHSLH